MSQIRHYVSIVSARPQYLTAFCKEAASTGGPSKLMRRKEWVEWCRRRNFSWISTHSSWIHIAKSQALNVTHHLCCTLPRVPFDTDENKNVLVSHVQQFVCAADQWLAEPTHRLHTHDTGLGNQKCCFTQLFWTWEQVLLTQIDNAWTWCYSYQMFDPPPHICYMPPVFCTLTLKSEMTPGELPG